MYADIDQRIEKIRGQMDRISFRMVEAEGEAYLELEAKLERLEEKLEKYTIWANDMEPVKLDYE